MTFSFRLQRLLELRQQHEQAKARELAGAQDAADVARKIEDALRAIRASSRAEVASAQTDALQVGYLHGLAIALQSIDSRIESAEHVTRSTGAAVTAAQSALSDAARDRRMLDRLKDRHTLQWRAEEAQRDRTMMDEIALNRYARPTSTEQTGSQPGSPDDDAHSPNQ